jgi:death-on-curing protein
VEDLAAAHAFALIQDHPYVDGNKRTALVALVAFLDLNGILLTATNTDAVSVMLRVAAGEMTKEELAAWVRAHSREAADVQPAAGRSTRPGRAR